MTGTRKPAAPAAPAAPKLTPELTPARRRALEVLADRHRRGRCGRVSNTTDLDEGLLYWQSAEWLTTQGLAEPIGTGLGWPSNTYLRITPAGIEAVG